MLTHCQQFFNSFSASSTPAWQMARAWHTRSPLRLARIRRALQTASHTPRCLSTPFLHATRTHPPTLRSAARMVDPTGCQRVSSPRQHTTPSATRSRPSRGVPACPRVFHSHPVQKLETGYIRFGVPTGDWGAYLREKLQGIWREAPGDLERSSRGFGEKLQGIWREAPGDLERRKMRQP